MKKIDINVNFVDSFKSKEANALVIPIFEDTKTKGFGKFSGIIQNIVSESKPSFGEVIVIHKPSIGKSLKFEKVLLISLGKEEKLDYETIRKLGGIIGSGANKYKFSSCTIADTWYRKKLDKETSIRTLVEGIFLGTYTFEEFFSEKKTKVNLKEVNIEFKGNFEKAIEETRIVAESVFLARDLQNLPSNIATPTYIANVVKEECEKVGISVKIIEKEEAEKLGMNVYLAVARGSEERPKFVVMEYKGGGDKWYSIAGKGITFDTGGISIKPSERMEEMKYDMSGAASVIGSMIAIARLGLKVNVVGITPLTENMPSGKATKPGDIVKSMGGISVEIINTDAEGRLILADALEYVKKYNPEFVIDIATLTGACVVALGHEAAGLMGNNSELIEIIKKSSQRTGERVWELPLWDEYNEYIKSDFADVKNVGNRYGGAITAAAFLKKFTNYKWAHMDIAGVAYTDKEKFYIKKGGTGFGVRLFVELFKSL
jgi:leucyl aminopeptidase